MGNWYHGDPDEYLKEALRTQVEMLREETEDYDDAFKYVEEIADELGIQVHKVIKELRAQCGIPEE